MGLTFNTGPSWDKDSLNQLQIDSIEENAKDMYKKRTCDLCKEKDKKIKK